MNEKDEDRPLCFVVSPIGDAASAIRKRSNGFLREVIQPVAEAAGYYVERADQDKTPGIVTEAIVEKLVSADLVIADLHGHNPNVMYEVAIRHATGMPIIQMIEEGEDLPFDIGGLNTIFYDPTVEGLGNWRTDLAQAIEGSKSSDTENPVSRASMFRALRASSIDHQTVLSSLLRSVENLRSEVTAGKSRASVSRSRSRVLLPPDKYVESEIVSFLQEHPAFEEFNFMVDCEDKELTVQVFPKELGEPLLDTYKYEFDWDEKGRIEVRRLRGKILYDVTGFLQE